MTPQYIQSFINLHRKQIGLIVSIFTILIVGFALQSLSLEHISPSGDGSDAIATKSVVGMRMSDGAVYSGEVDAKTEKFHGHGTLKKGNSVYEGNWKNGTLSYGKRTTKQSVYEGRFDSNLNLHGFGIISYSQEYINGKRNQGLSDNEIIATYIGNWTKNVKSGLGRAIMADASMKFGNYKNGIFQKVAGAKYSIGDKVYGIDVSRHQIDIDWNRLALYCDKNGNVYSGKPSDKKYMQPVFFVYIKATEGATIQDKTFDIRMIEAERHGIAKGAYHFLRLGSSVDEQIDNFTKTAKWTPGDLPPALDVEVESEIKKYGVDKLLDMTFSWLEKMEAKMNVRPIIYTRENIRDKYLKKDPRFKKYQCWIARYHPDGPISSKWKFWQMTEKGRLNGYNGAIDINLYNGDYNDFTTYLKEL